jgi:exodeoxyribonuclease-3
MSPDILLLQEIKCEATQFPADNLAALGYRAEIIGQKSYNGVAALGKIPFAVTHRALPGLGPEDSQARYIELVAEKLTIIGIYLPNGNSGGDAGYTYKLAWMDALRARIATLLDADTELVVTGDFNVCPTDEDFAPGSLSVNDALVRPETRAKFRSLLWQAGAWPRDCGLRIDHALLSPAVAERLVSATPDRRERGEEQPSDHVPVTIEIA